MVPRTKNWLKPVDQMDVWLDTQGLYRKHTARDGTCLFRAVSEQLFLTQTYHLEVREQTVEYEMKYPEKFQEMTTVPIEEHADKIRNPREWGGKIEIFAMALNYKCDFIIFTTIEEEPENYTNFGYDKKVMLSLSPERHYDSVYSKEFIADAAFCQATAYEILYKNVFNLREVDYAVGKMLHDKHARAQREPPPFLACFSMRMQMRDSSLNVKELLDVGITPFPYKVAKSLDPEIYRNVEYDTWNEHRKGLRYGFCAWTCRDLQVGVKCKVKIDDDIVHLGYIQEMQPRKGPVVVFIEKLGQKITVPYATLEMLPPETPPALVRPLCSLKNPPIVSFIDSRSDEEGRKRNPKYIRPRIKEKTDKSTENEPSQVPTVSSTEFYEYDPQNDDEHRNANYPSQDSAENEDRTEVYPDSTATHLDFKFAPYTAGPPLTLPLPEMPHSYPAPAVPISLVGPRPAEAPVQPYSDVPTFRFIYNVGVDYPRMNYLPWNVRSGPPYYVHSTYPPHHSAYVPQSPYETYNPPFPSDGRPADAVPPSENVENDVPNLIHLPPRMRKKRETPNGIFYEPQLQQTPANPNVPMSPVFYPPVDYDSGYCMYPYVDFNMYDYSPNAYSPTYIGPDGVVYQTVQTPNT